MFSSYLSNGEKSTKRDHGNEFRGSKNGGKEVWVGLEWPKNIKIRRPTLAAAAAFAGPIWARPAVVRHEIRLARSSGGGAPPWPAHVEGGVAGIASHGQNPFGLKAVQNYLVRGPQVLEKFSRVLELKMSVLRLGFYLARKNMFI